MQTISQLDPIGKHKHHFCMMIFELVFTNARHEVAAHDCNRESVFSIADVEQCFGTLEWIRILL